MFQNFDDPGGPALGRKHLPLLRKALDRLGLDGFIVPHEDEWQNEYVPPAYDRLAWLTGFTGSAGAAVVLKDEAAVFVDGRYTLQVRDQVDNVLFAYRDLVEGGVSAYLAEHAPQSGKIGYDPKLVSPDTLDRWRASIAGAGAQLIAVAPNPIDSVWSDRPALPAAPVAIHAEAYAGESAADKRKRLGRRLEERARRSGGDHLACFNRLVVQYSRPGRCALAAAARRSDFEPRRRRRFVSCAGKSQRRTAPMARQ